VSVVLEVEATLDEAGVAKPAALIVEAVCTLVALWVVALMRWYWMSCWMSVPNDKAPVANWSMPWGLNGRDPFAEKSSQGFHESSRVPL
jgi:hypothetical protein